MLCWICELYRPRHQETCEEIEDGIECRCNDGGYLIVRSDRYSHHTIVCKSEERAEHSKDEP